MLGNGARTSRYSWRSAIIKTVKPRIFIGSSKTAKDYAGAIHDSLVDVAECTVWTEGAFGLSQSTVANLMKHFRNSDFGIFGSHRTILQPSMETS